jgi:deoxyribose-phosphate aldolase
VAEDAKELEAVVEEITRRVARRLQEMGIGSEFVEQAVRCALSPENCVYCGLCIIKKPEDVNKIVDLGAVRISANPGVTRKPPQGLAGMIDHTLLKPEATRGELTRMCDEAKQYGFATVCVNSTNIPFVARQLRGSTVKPIAVVGFPLGAASAQAKAYEAKEAVRAGAEEIDMVINIGALKSKDYLEVYDDICRVVQASHPKKVKVIIETSALTDEEKVIASALSKAAGAAFVKTSTGFGSGGATVEDIELIRKVVGQDMEIKASGGIRTKEDAEAMVKAGATRIGASASVAIVTGKKAGAGKY